MVVYIDTPPEDKYLVYVNEKRQINTVKCKLYQVQDMGTLLHAKIYERHLICGFVKNGFTVTQPYDIAFLPLTALEKYLFVNTNINFEIQSNQFREANSLFVFHEFAHIGGFVPGKGGTVQPDDPDYPPYLADLILKIEESYIHF